MFRGLVGVCSNVSGTFEAALICLVGTNAGVRYRRINNKAQLRSCWTRRRGMEVGNKVKDLTKPEHHKK